MKRFCVITKILLGLAITVLSLSCSRQLRESFSSMMVLKQGVIEKYRAEDSSIQIFNGKSLIVSIINSPFNDLDESTQKEKAKEIAIWVKGQYKESGSLDSIVITFVRHKSYLLVFNANQARSYRFKMTELPSTLMGSVNILPTNA
ncbi:MAG: hypothetical protein U0P81_01260 [Holophagaceae bacterium]